MTKYIPPSKEEVIEELRPWIKGFVKKEYPYLDDNDQEDYVQEGCLSLILVLNKLAEPRFKSKDDYTFYVKAVVRNAVRDYSLKFRSRFDISLYKLRRYLKQQKQVDPDYSLGEFMGSVGDEHAYLVEETDFIERGYNFEVTQKRLSLLSEVQKSGRNMPVEECRRILKEVIQEVKKARSEES